jgi:ABC-type nitrate/sulfonate/bicarbonate transport system substrate-binding protein
MARRHRIAALALAVGLAAPAGTAAAVEAIVLQLPREAQFRFAGYYAALWQGFYREAGLEVEVKEGGASIEPVREVAEGHARFGVGGAELLLRTAHGLPLLVLAPIFQRSGTAVYIRAGSGYGSPEALAKGRVGRPPASDVRDFEFRAMLEAAGIDPDKLKSVSVEPGQTVAALAERRIDAGIGSAWEEPWQAYRRGLALEAFDLPDEGAAFYGDSLFTSQRFAAAEPEIVRRFRAASLRGWAYALQNPDRIIVRMVAERRSSAPAADRAAFARYQSEIARRLAHYPELPLGASSPERWKRVERNLSDIGALPSAVDLRAFLYDPEARGPSGIGRHVAVVAAAATAVLVAAVLWWRRRTRARDIPRPAIPTDLEAMLAGLEKRLRRRLPRPVELRLSPAPETWLCEADAAAVAGAVLALAEEAAAQMPGGGTVIVGTRLRSIDDGDMAAMPGGTPGDYVRLTVKDDGPGLAANRLDDVFDPAATARPAVVGARTLVERLGGFAHVESAEGIGTAVHLYFRRAAADGAEADEIAAEERAEAA